MLGVRLNALSTPFLFCNLYGVYRCCQSCRLLDMVSDLPCLAFPLLAVSCYTALKGT